MTKVVREVDESFPEKAKLELNSEGQEVSLGQKWVEGLSVHREQHGLSSGVEGASVWYKEKTLKVGRVWWASLILILRAMETH